MLLNILRSGDMTSSLISILLCFPIILFSLSLHETAHGYAAYLLGDRTAYNLGRLTLNPMKHLDPIGFLCMLLVGFGWAKPVPINARNFKNPRWGMALSAAAGPASNILLAFLSAIILRIAMIFVNINESAVSFVIVIFLQTAMQMNIALAVFNFIPIPPLDGSRVLYVLLPTKWYFGIMKYERYILLVFYILLAFGGFSGIISTVTYWIMDGMLYIVGL